MKRLLETTLISKEQTVTPIFQDFVNQTGSLFTILVSTQNFLGLWTPTTVTTFLEGGICFCLYFCPYLSALPRYTYLLLPMHNHECRNPSSVNSSLSRKNASSKHTSIQLVLKMAISTPWEMFFCWFFFFP